MAATVTVIPELNNEDLVIGTHPERAKTGMGHLCAIINTRDDNDAEKQYILTYEQQTIRMHSDFAWTNDSSEIRAHAEYATAKISIQPFLNFKFGDRVEFMRDPKFGCPVFIGKHVHGAHVLVSYVFSTTYTDGNYAPRVAVPIDEFMNKMDGNSVKKIKVKYINNEGELITAHVATEEEITDMKQLIYKMG